MTEASDHRPAARRALFAAAAVGITGAVVAPSAGSVGDVGVDDLAADAHGLIASKIATAQKGAPGGVATLDASGIVPRAQRYVPAVVGETDRTSELQELLNADGARYHRIQLDEGVYVAEGLRLGHMCTLEGAAGGTTRFEAIDQRWGAVTLRRPEGSRSMQPIVTLDGAGAALRNVTLYSGPTTATAIEVSGFESELDSIRMISGDGIALDVALANNPRWRSIYIDNHGSAELPAMRIRSSPVGVSTTNNVSIYDLTIERSANVALEVGPDAVVEWLRFYGLHVENPLDGRGQQYLGNTDPLIHFGNVRRVDVIGGMLYGGPGAIIRHDQPSELPYGGGGIKLTNVTLLGADESTSSNANRGLRSASPILVELARGDDFSAVNCSFLRYTDAAVAVGPDYGEKVVLDASNTVAGTELADARTARRVLAGQVTAGRLRGDAGQPTVAAARDAGVIAPELDPASADSAGTVSFGTGAATAAGPLVRIAFAEPFARRPIVTVSATNAASAALALYADASETELTVYAANRPRPGQPDGAFSVNWIALG